MSAQLDELYLTWLYSQVGDVRIKNPTRTCWSLLRQLYRKEFVWLIPNDDNRVEDGRALRDEFIEQREIQDVDPMWMDLGCSVLEMLVALSRRLAFEAEGEPRNWFWELITNLGLDYCNDVDPDLFEEDVNTRIEILIWRMYRPNGSGGLFPLKRPREDQRDIEIWYQLSAYLLERT